MPKELRKGLGLPAALCLLWAITGCQTLHAPTPNTHVASVPSIEIYAHQLAQLDAPELTQRLLKAQAAWNEDNSAANRARLGLVRAQWGYSGFDLEQAVQDLQDSALEAGADWSPSELAFLQFQAAQLGHMSQLKAQVAAATSQTNQLKQELEHAKEKLRAITNIERDINRQKP